MSIARFACFSALLLLGVAACRQEEPIRMKEIPGHVVTANDWKTFRPDSGIVSDSIAAIQLGEVYISHIFGSGILKLQLPLQATLEGDHWRVNGVLPPNHVGGVAVVRISREDGRILQIMHGL